MTLNDIVKIFIEFMSKAGYEIIPPDSLISNAFPTTFNVSGGPNFVEYYLEEGIHKSLNKALIQYCVRHWDYENVGDGKHLSFFEMPVAFCINGFSRRKLYQDYLNLITKHLGLPIERLWITLFSGGEVHGEFFPRDDEAIEIWSDLGIPKEKIVELEPNYESFVANTIEPVGGPRSEIFYQTDLPERCTPYCKPGICECGRYLEFWTSLHYTQKVTTSHPRSPKEKASFSFEPISADKIYAAGFGLERLASIVNNYKNIYQVETVAQIASALSDYLYKRGKILTSSQPTTPFASILSNYLLYKIGKAAEYNVKSVIVIAEHIRGILFLIKDGAHKLTGGRNRSRSYVYRLYLKNFFTNLSQLNLFEDEEVLCTMINEVVNVYKARYEDIEKIKSEVLEEIKYRKTRFIPSTGKWLIE